MRGDRMCMEQAEAKEPHAPAAAASQCYYWVQNSFLWCRKALVRGCYEVLYRQHMRTFLLGMGSGTLCDGTAAVRGCECRM